jgi:hypothetical protein
MRLLFKVNTKILKIGYSNMLIKQLMKIERCWFNLKHGGYISAVTVLPQMFAKAWVEKCNVLQKLGYLTNLNGVRLWSCIRTQLI